MLENQNQKQKQKLSAAIAAVIDCSDCSTDSAAIAAIIADLAQIIVRHAKPPAPELAPTSEPAPAAAPEPAPTAAPEPVTAGVTRERLDEIMDRICRIGDLMGPNINNILEPYGSRHLKKITDAHLPAVHKKLLALYKKTLQEAVAAGHPLAALELSKEFPEAESAGAYPPPSHPAWAVRGAET